MDSSLLVRTDFANDDARQRLNDEAQQESQDGFRAYLVPVSDPAFDHLDWEAVSAALPVGDHGALVLFIADSTTLNSPDHPVLVVDLSRDADYRPFRCIPSELCSVENNLNLANMDWEDFAGAVDDDGVFRGFSSYRPVGTAAASQRHVRALPTGPRYAESSGPARKRRIARAIF